MRFGLSSACPHSFGSPFIGPTDVFPSFPSCLSVFTIVRTLVCTHTRTRILLTTFVTMRFGSSVVPLHLVLLHRQPRTLFVGLVLFIFICPFCVHMCLASFPGRMETTHASLRGGVCVCVTLGIKGTFRFGTGGRDTTGISRPTKRMPAGRSLPRLSICFVASSP